MLPQIQYIDNETVTDPVAIDDKEGRLAIRGKIDAFEGRLKAFFGSDRGDMDEIDDNGLKEHFIDGVYIRELFIPAGVAIVSHLWRRDRLWIIAKGDVTFTTEVGTQRVKGPHTQIAPFGSKVGLFANEDTLWFAIAASESDNSEDVEKELKAKDYTELTYPWDRLEDQA